MTKGIFDRSPERGRPRSTTFVSRDADLVERFEGVARRLFDLRVAAPGDCLQELWDRVSEPYAPAQIEHTRFRLEAASASAKDELSAAFLNTGLGEKKRDFARLLRGQRADPANCDMKVVRDGDNRCVALYGRSILGQVLDVAVLRAAGPAARTIARHVVHLQRRRAVDSGVPFIRISEVSLSPHLISALTSESFVESKDGWWAAAVNRHADAETLAQFLSALTDAPDDLGLLTAADSLRSGVERETVAELERRFAPMKLTGGPLPTYLVPIKPHWAEQLFDSDLVAQTLLRRNDILGLSREHVYYSGASPGTLAAPARILWYVSAGKVPGGRRAGTCAVRACSRLEEVVVDRPQTLHRRFSHLGIYTEDDVLAAANKWHRAMALRFADTEVFTHPVVLADLRDLADEYGHTLVLRSPQRMVEHLFDALYSRGTQ